MNTAATPFAGKNLLDQLSTSCKSELLDLLYALELAGTDADRCKGLELVYSIWKGVGCCSQCKDCFSQRSYVAI